MDADQLLKKLKTIQKLPSCPRIIPEIIRLVRNPLAGMSEYEKVISRDPALMAQVLRVVNSSYYNLPRKVSDLKLALSFLGNQEIYRIVLNASFYQVLHSVFDKLSYDFNIFWRHSQLTANAARFLAGKFGDRYSGEAYAAGLLHDVGKLIMEQFFPREWEKVIIEFETSKREFYESESKIFGVSHAEIGALLLEVWQIPAEIVIAVRYHHRPFQAPANKDMVSLIYFADKTATSCTHFFHEGFHHEAFLKDQLWDQMITRYPHFKILENEKLVANLKSEILKEIPVHV